jgi:two-component system chemotaxis response regulator CheB
VHRAEAPTAASTSDAHHLHPCDIQEQTHDIIVIAASAGGVESLMRVIRALPEDLPAAVFIVLHMPPSGPSALPGLLSRGGALPCAHAVDGASVTAGHVLIAPPDHRMLLDRGVVRLSRRPTERRSARCRSALPKCGARVRSARDRCRSVGNLDDGTAGLQSIKLRGGIAIAQDPAEAPYPGMPSSAIANVAVDHVSPLDALPALLQRLTREPAPPTPPSTMTDELERERDLRDAGRRVTARRSSR